MPRMFRKTVLILLSVSKGESSAPFSVTSNSAVSGGDNGFRMTNRRSVPSGTGACKLFRKSQDSKSESVGYNNNEKFLV